jgi:hypothetical protein
MLGFLWKKKSSYTWIHKDKKVPSTWKHVEGVIKIVYLTLKQKQKNNPTQQQSLLLLQTCENSKTISPT